MISLFHYALLLLFLCGAWGVSAEGAVHATCPADCGKADEWCTKTFGKGGQVTSRDCGRSSFECVCNGASAVLVSSAEGKCKWSDSFEQVDRNGSFCFPHTALCPKNCEDASGWISNCAGDIRCISNEQGFNFNCTTCEGLTYSIVGDTNTCKKQLLGGITSCDPLTTCNGHGCCSKPGTGADICICYSDKVNGFWDQPFCSTCDPLYDSPREGCKHRKPVIQVILSSFGNTWTMVLPNFIVLFLFVVLGLTRSKCESDRSFQATALRRTGLSAVQVARRNQRSQFHSKYIPKRPAQSRCFLNREESSVHLHATQTSTDSSELILVEKT